MLWTGILGALIRRGSFGTPLFCGCVVVHFCGVDDDAVWSMHLNKSCWARLLHADIFFNFIFQGTREGLLAMDQTQISKTVITKHQ